VGVVQVFGLQNRRPAGTGAITNAAGYLTFIK
jgi:hypothetical protein